MWLEGRPIKKPYLDFNKWLVENVRGEIQEENVHKTLVPFLRYNIGFTVKMLTGFEIYPDQRIVIKGWFNKNHTLTVAGRGYSKSWLFSHFCYLYCLFNPGKTVIMIAPTFRSSRKIVENIEKWALSDDGVMLRQCLKPNGAGAVVTKKPDSYIVQFKNGSQIIALPLGDADRLRGYRCSVLGIDEGLLISQQIIDTVLKPFMVATAEEELKRRQRIRNKERRLIAAGKIRAEEATKFGSESKMIILSSASYAWQDLFTLYKKYLKIIYSEDPEMMVKMTDEEKKKLAEDKDSKADTADDDDIPLTYLVQQLSYEVAPWDRIDKAVREEIKSGMYSQSTIDREYRAHFVQDSEGYFRAKTMEECTLVGANEPTCELLGEKGAEYIFAIDQSMAGSETADHFAICVLKIIKNQDGKKIGLVVHQYANAGAKLDDHIAYLYYLLKAFDPVYVALDSSGGDNMDFISVANSSALFRDKKIELKALDVDFGRESFDHLAEEIRRSYNKMEGRIVQRQYFHTPFQRAANEYLQASFNRRTILFPAKITSNTDRTKSLREQATHLEIVKLHPDFQMDRFDEEGRKSLVASYDEFVERQDILIDLVKKECAMIQISTSSLGHVSFDLPQHVKRNNKSASRNRKDSYSALFLANWAMKLYLDSLNKPLHTEDEWFAAMVGRR